MLREIIHRLATVVYWTGFVLAIIAETGAVLLFVATNSDDAARAGQNTIAAALLVLGLAVHGAGWAVRYILTGETKWLPWHSNNRYN